MWSSAREARMNSSMDPTTCGCASVGWPARTYLHKLCADTGHCLEDQPEVMDERNGWWRRVKEIHAAMHSKLDNNDDDDDISLIGKNLSLLNYSHYFGLVVRVFANGPGDLGSIPGRVIPKTQKMVLDATLLNTQHYKVQIKGEVEQSRERSSALPYTLV